MNTSVLKGSFTLGAADFSRKALLAVTVLLCARFLPPGRFGDYIFLLTFYQVFAVLAGAGLPSSVLRVVARSKESGMRVGFASVLARLLYTVPASALMYPVIWVMGLSAQYFSALGLLALMMLVRGAAENITFIFQGREDQVSCAKVGVSQSAVTLLATLTICLTSKELLWLIGAHVLGGFASAIYGFVLLRVKSGRDVEPGTILGQTWSILRESHWLNAGTFVASVYNRVDVLLLRRLLTSEAVAIYAAPYRILDVTQIVPSSLMGTILPSLCRVGEPDSRMMHPRLAMRFLLVIAFPLVVAVTIAAPWITLFLFGRRYQASIPVLQVLIWATVPMFWNFVLNAQLIANSFDRAILYAASVGLALNVGCNLLLIPRFGYLACAPVTLLTEIFILALNLHFVSRIGAAAWPENLGRLALTTVFVAGFSFCWTRAASAYTLVGAVLLVLALLSLPISWSDFSTAGARNRTARTTAATHVG
jgi:O-antigen/teichoic acid export membrane protein